jgi:molybdopterin-guanine dinucleotide biosynthesis protein A
VQGSAVRETLCGVVLAGGRSRRMGYDDKALLPFAGLRLLDRAIARAAPQVRELIVSANGDPARFGPLGVPVVPDGASGPGGPLAGIVAALRWVRLHRPGLTGVVSFAVDTPFFPVDLAERLHRERELAGAPLAIAASGGRLHPVFGLWPLAAEPGLAAALSEPVTPSLRQIVALRRAAVADFAIVEVDPFLNLNTPEDIRRALPFEPSGL